jgi:hypothetical protein
MHTMATTKAKSHPFRIILRGTKDGKRVRAAFVHPAPNSDAVNAYIAANEKDLTKRAGFKPDFVNVFPPVPAYCVANKVRPQ